MTVEKSRLRAAAFAEVAGKFEDLFYAAKEECREAAGIRGALRLVLDKLQVHTQGLDKAFADSNGGMDKTVYDAQKRAIAECGGIVRNLLATADDNFLRMQGKVAATEQAFKISDGYHQIEAGKMTRLGDAVVEDSGESLPVPLFRRVEGQHPGDPLAARRAEAAKGNGGSGPQAPPVHEKPKRRRSKKIEA